MGTGQAGHNGRGRAKPTALRGRSAAATSLVIGLIALGCPAGASASFTRPFLRQITGTEAGPLQLEGAGGAATDAGENLWLATGRFPNAQLNEFAPPSEEDHFVKTVPVEAFTIPASLAIEAGNLYVTGKESVRAVGETSDAHRVESFDSGGALVDRWPEFGGPSYVAGGNGSVFVSHGEANPEAPAGDGEPIGVEKFTTGGEATPYEPATPEPYINGNEITGTPVGVPPAGCESASFEQGLGAAGPVAADPAGNLYVVDNACELNTPAILEYGADGTFIRSITGAETPGLRGTHEEGGFGALLSGITVDRLAHHVLVSLARPGIEAAAVDEFDAQTGRYLDQITTVGEGEPLRGPVQMTTDAGGDLYVVDTALQAVDVYGPGRFLPGLRVEDATHRTSTTATLNGVVDPEGFPLAGCRFEYVTEAAFNEAVEAHGGVEAEGFADLSSGGEAPCEPEAAAVPADLSYHAVHAEVGGLTKGVTYRFRLVATSGGPLGGTGASNALAFTAKDAPKIDGTSASNISSTFADLHAQIDPLGASTTYYFQYVDEAHYDAAALDPYAAGATAPLPPGSLGSGGPTGSSEESAFAHVSGLNPDTVYHYRVVAQNEVGISRGQDAIFTTLAGVVQGLPDGRGYELLTPPDKGSAADMFAAPAINGEYVNKDVGSPSDTGEAFLLETQAAFGAFPGALNSDYVFQRAAGGWRFTSLASASGGVQSLSASVFDSTDLSRFGLADDVGSSASEAGLVALDLVGPPGGPYETLHADTPITEALEQEALIDLSGATQIAGASPDVSHVVLQGKDRGLCPGAEQQDEGVHALCEWTHGSLTLLNANSEGEPVSPCGTELGQGFGAPGATKNAVSNDGERAFFTAPDPTAPGEEPGCWRTLFGIFNLNAPQLYMHAGNDTIRVSKPTDPAVTDPCTLPPPEVFVACHPAAYVGAAEDGSKVFFVTQSSLTKDDEGISDQELYEYDATSGTLTRISSGESKSAAANVLTVSAISANGGIVYFQAHGKLTADAPEETEALVGLYRYDTITHHTTYIASLPAREVPTGHLHWFPSTEEVAPHPDGIGFYTTPDGRYLLFSTSRELTSYSTASSDPRCGTLPDKQGAPSNGHCIEIYRYDAQTGRPPICISCDPNGEAPVSHASITRSSLFQRSSAPMRAMSDNGAFVFFDTADALVPQDTNNTLDVYEWHEGHVSLISSGTDSGPSFFLGSSPAVVGGREVEGANVFFGTHARLVPQDRDGAGDVYDARIGGGFATPPSGTAACEGDACQSPPAMPTDATPPSSTFSGPGNLAPPAAKKLAPKRCRKGRGLKRHRCVKAIKRKHRRHSSRASHASHARGASR
jgi:hypothetical protein